ncbi:tRNA dimethylallyltransferase, mitochondrial [Lecanosticta acicola]|uniref:tRNA dimethylallyltransferase n=1 Tax=Lecanosticta acicola TaxID=111012 RepID=A0AAI8Z435_9PEZI|nr:tRNA dimethylallyltransferase, mitochondrial [Lecanosticta acicola]
MARSRPSRPLICVIGATGTGKSQLAVEIAKRYNGEIINGDAMQLYAGLPVITNKITPEERQGIPHHLLGCIGLHEQTWVVGAFVRNALKVIEEIRSRGKLPILVGGTHYYTQSLLFKDRLAEKEEAEEEFVENMADKWPILNESTAMLLEELKRVDPVMAERWHPKDRRKIQRSLEIYLQTGRKASDIYADQRARKSANGDAEDFRIPDGLSMRFSTLLFWIHAETNALRDRLDQRVEKMLQHGLLEEVDMLTDYARSQAEEGEAVDETRGIWVSIGYKEFKSYALARQQDCTDVKRLSKLKAEGVEKTQIATRQYSKRQVKWIRIKLVNALADAGATDRLYLLDGSDVSNFADVVVRPALELTEQFLQGQNMPSPSSLSPVAAELLVPKREDFAATPQMWTKQHCSACEVTCVTPEQWKMHTGSKKHKKLVAKEKKNETTPDAPA